jgi:hypothetical protein
MQIKIATTQAKIGRAMKKPGMAQRVSYGRGGKTRMGASFCGAATTARGEPAFRA